MLINIPLETHCSSQQEDHLIRGGLGSPMRAAGFTHQLLVKDDVTTK